MFGSGPTEEIRLESKTAQQVAPDEQESQARFNEKLDHNNDDAAGRPSYSMIERFKRWFSARF
jgi:hypothetical protein